MRTTRGCVRAAIPLILAAMAVGLAVPASATLLPPQGSVSNYAQYQSFNQSSFGSLTGLGTASALATASPDGSIDNHSTADGWAEFFAGTAGRLGARSELSGVSPGFDPPTELYASSYVSNSSSWEVVSATLPVGTPVDLSIALHFDGTLTTGEWFGANVGDVTASANSNASFYFGGFGDHRNGGVTLDAAGGFTTNSDWDTYGSWVTTEPSAREKQSVGVVDVPSWTMSGKVGDEVSLYLNLSTSVWAVGPYEVMASSDFLSTGYFTINGLFEPGTTNRADAELRLAAVPEPGSAAALGVMIIGLVPAYLRGRKRRS